MGAQLRNKSWRGEGFLSLWPAVSSTGWPVGQFCLSACLFLVELVASRVTGSLLLLSCAFHTLGGVLAVAVALTDAWLATGGHPSCRNTFGWVRARTAGTLASAVFLSALCLVLLPEALRRVTDPRVTQHALVLMGIGAVGIPIHLSRVGLHGRRPQDLGTRQCCSRRRVTEGDSCAQEMEELVASRVTGSLLLLSCAFHTLGGVLAVAVALTDAWLATGGHPSCRNTFGWVRARTAGTLASAVFLSALCLVLLPEALRRVTDPRVTQHALVLMGIGAVGIPIHLSRVGLHGRRPQDLGTRQCCSRRRVTEGDSCAQEMEDLLSNGSSANGQPWMEEDREISPMPPSEKLGQWTALCLGRVVACLGPVAVLLYSLLLYLLWPPCLGDAACFSHCPGSPCWAWHTAEALQWGSTPCWLLYLDPGLAMAVSVALLCLVWPALRGSALVLMQAAPEELDLRLLELQLRATEGVVAVQELYVWQLEGPSSLVGTAHVRCRDVATCEAVMDRVQRVFCEHGIHAATVQPDLGICPGGGWCKGVPRKRCLAPCPALVMEYETTV